MGDYANLQKLGIRGTDVDVHTRFLPDPSVYLTILARYSYILRSIHLKEILLFPKFRNDWTGFKRRSLVDLIGRVGNLEFIRLDTVRGIDEEDLVASLWSHRGTLKQLEIVDVDFLGTYPTAAPPVPDTEEFQLISAFEVLHRLEVIQLSRVSFSLGSSLDNLLERMGCPDLVHLTLGKGPPADLPGVMPHPSVPVSNGIFVDRLPCAERILDFVTGLGKNKGPRFRSSWKAMAASTGGVRMSGMFSSSCAMSMASV